MKNRVVLASLLLVLAACGSEGTRSGAGRAEPPPTESTSRDREVLYEASAVVLEDRSHGPMLCLGGIASSLPPQCGDVPIRGWSWETVAGEQSRAGTRWGSFHVTGRYDGETFKVTDVAPHKGESSGWEDIDFTSPCEEPPGGWPIVEEATQENARPVHAYARSQPDYLTSWVTHLRPAELEFSPVVVNVVFTRDRARHEAAIKQVWDGPLCVVERVGLSARELARIRREAEEALPALGLKMLWSAGPSVEPRIDIGVVADPDGRAQASFDARYGTGTVQLIPALKPVR